MMAEKDIRSVDCWAHDFDPSWRHVPTEHVPMLLSETKYWTKIEALWHVSFVNGDRQTDSPRREKFSLCRNGFSFLVVLALALLPRLRHFHERIFVSV